MTQSYKSHAKINLFLRIMGQRSDGYHNIQSIFQLIDLHDEISIKKRKDSLIKIKCNVKEIENNNLIIKSIDHFLGYTQLPNVGLDIILKKNIPIGGGLGGGSSNAATCLIALNEIYETKLSAIQLKGIARQIGCDVPFFLHQKNAWVEGTGDIITPIFVKPTWLVMIFSKHNISTSDIFSKYTHKNHFREFSYDDYLENNTINDFEEIVFKNYPSIHQSYKYLSSYGRARMTGTGGTVFLPLPSYEEAKKVLSRLPKKEISLIVKSLDI